VATRLARFRGSLRGLDPVLHTRISLVLTLNCYGGLPASLWRSAVPNPLIFKHYCLQRCSSRPFQTAHRASPSVREAFKQDLEALGSIRESFNKDTVCRNAVRDVHKELTGTWAMDLGLPGALATARLGNRIRPHPKSAYSLGNSQFLPSSDASRR
jgi:hypothetical protein